MKVGDYVRTKYGIIAKITDIIEDLSIDCDRNVYYENSLNDNMPMMEIPYNLKDEYIINSNPNIIGLIEVGDYVNGYYVEDITNTGEELVLHIITGSNYFQSPFLYNEDIKSVLTHEQFEAMKYVVGDTNVKD